MTPQSQNGGAGESRPLLSNGSENMFPFKTNSSEQVIPLQQILLL
jgi:hypothetical protein